MKPGFQTADLPQIRPNCSHFKLSHSAILLQLYNRATNLIKEFFHIELEKKLLQKKNHTKFLCKHKTDLKTMKSYYI